VVGSEEGLEREWEKKRSGRGGIERNERNFLEEK